MLLAIFCVGVLLALASRFLRRRIRYACAPIALNNMLKGPSSRARASPIGRSSTSASFDALDGWRTLELWKRAEQSRPFCSNSSNSDDGSVDSASNIGLPQSVAVSKSNFRLAFARGYAAVLVGLFQSDDGEIRVILTKRAQALSSHSGEVALPGGKRDEEDANDAATALREAKEEIGLDPSLVKVVKTVEPFVSKKLLRVTPVIGLIAEGAKFRPVPNPGEVDAVFNVPLEMFLKDQGHRYEERKWFGYTYRLHFFEHQTENNKWKLQTKLMELHVFNIGLKGKLMTKQDTGALISRG
ncbi:hypothetical protein GOP47_0016821 [Adiantum capillus-veneris]|uniref:Nudix hydrolase domain-containing protein n=1 Tax=Adiantum capillus-veneris TaxID=13818 RepID=A0A9D4UJD1_ADICA|nr:hypothetical protein GOP47_0016821 [Adiantum capillus-veneris]